MKIKYHYYRDFQKAPRVTVCELIDDGDIPAAVGVAICGWRDQPKYSVGRKIAYSRALHAFFGQEPALPVLPYYRGQDVIDSCYNFMGRRLNITHKSIPIGEESING